MSGPISKQLPSFPTHRPAQPQPPQQPDEQTWLEAHPDEALRAGVKIGAGVALTAAGVGIAALTAPIPGLDVVGIPAGILIAGSGGTLIGGGIADVVRGVREHAEHRAE